MAKSKSQTYPYCEHNRMGDSCEDCAYQRAVAEGQPVSPVAPAETRAAAEKRAADGAASA
jgi:hypothetical protein